ncbi:uncharacterized protein LOC128920218 [Zeugodacus cucurbitae]|uniref:uncharacterized protein LOC128920218 n=1 Tax=Zeugodacus cucurbitae TaxID=28588 RepID=UPI0023D9309A|nr:uncharacterized protein LOC128920218 [Zeugodacus cucurbitae]
MSMSESNVEIVPHLQRIFLYIQLKTIENLPTMDGKLEIHLSQAKNTLTKLVDVYPSDNIIDLSIFDEYKPTFSLMVEQDNIDDANILSDNPLLITLYNRIKVRVPPDELSVQTRSSEDERVKRKESVKENKKHGKRTHKSMESIKSMKSMKRDLEEVIEEEEMEIEIEETEIYEEQLRPIAQGHIDLLKLYTKKRELATFYTILYQISITEDAFSSCTAAWEIYALLPLLKEMTFHNMVHVSFESIFNVKLNLIENVDSLVADFYFESKILNENNEYEKVKFCTFQHFNKQQVTASDVLLGWENLRSHEPNNFDCIGICCNFSINTFHMFRHMVYEENSKIHTNKVDFENLIITSNATHRFVLTKEFVQILEDIIAFDEQQILIELYHNDKPEEIIVKGHIDPSILLYPEVTSKRFAVELSPTVTRQTVKQSVKPTSTKFSTIQMLEEPTFAIISICFSTPLTESSILTNLQDSVFPKLQSKTHENISSRMAAHYTFEKEIKKLILYIVKNDIKKLEDAKQVLCCQKENLTNVMFKLISSDFNIQKPTKDSIEFHNLMTMVYKDSVQSTCDILKKLGNHASTFTYNQTENDDRILKYLSIAQYLSVLGDEHFAKILCDKAEKLAAGDTIFSFFKLVMLVEKKDFENAKKYYSLPSNEQFELGKQFSELIKIYINYVETLANETTFNEAMENLIVSLREITVDFPNDICFWVLLHSIFKYCAYLPGMNYTRWKYEQLDSEVDLKIPLTPTTRFALMNSYEIKEPVMPRESLFIKVFTILTSLGLYKFAVFVFKEFEKLCSPFEQYLTHTALKILASEVLTNYQSKTFPVTKNKSHWEQAMEKYYIININGHLEYSRGAVDLAMQNYLQILMNDNEMPHEYYSLALLRYGFHMMKIGNYQEALEAFLKCENSDINLIAKFGMGKALFKMKRLDEAERELAICTTFKVHIPDVWGYLALINLLLKRNFKALEFWKYAKIHPNVEFSKDLQEDLGKVDISDVVLYIDKPPVVPCMTSMP